MIEKVKRDDSKNYQENVNRLNEVTGLEWCVSNSHFLLYELESNKQPNRLKLNCRMHNGYITIYLNVLGIASSNTIIEADNYDSGAGFYSLSLEDTWKLYQSKVQEFQSYLGEMI
ncbi:hypothetical protein N9137_00860 [Pseudomonadales bacterium]|nr:hypothetical protein [Pseudomonadales bacterium]